ncbi:MAG: hypothetical protein GY938_13165 [Ketobacter sp.]|nr:hypothetical protein [Ketobacter sp.]
MSQVLMLLNTFVVQFEEDKDTGMNLQDIVGNAIEFHGNSCTSKAQGRFKKIVEKAARESEKNVEKRPNYF